MRIRLYFILIFTCALACSDTESSSIQAPTRWTDEPRLTHDVDRDIDALLELDRIEGACDRYDAGETDQETKLLCGKWMFFYETFGTVGIPTALLEFGQTHYQDYYGPGFSNFDFVPDPASERGMPLGLAESTATIEGAVEVRTRAFTCASCHFGQMPDGRYAVGYGNLQLEYGRFIAGLGAPLTLSIEAESEAVDPRIRDELLPFIEQASARDGYDEALAELVVELAPLGMSGPFEPDAQSRFLDLEPGTMDFLTPPLVDDGVWTVSRIISLWNLPSARQREAAGMPTEMLSWTGGTRSLEQFITGFVALGVADTDAWPSERIAPLEAYVRSLRVPELERELDPDAVARGARSFVDAGCVDCHNGPSGESNQAYDYDELGVDDQMRFVFNPDDRGDLCCGFDSDPDAYDVTGGIKAPRLTGVDFQSRFLHNGSLTSLEQLLCLEERPTDDALGQGSEGHEYGCGLSQAERLDIISYLTSL